jgi:hypothetical protein
LSIGEQKFFTGKWNHLSITMRDGAFSTAVNGLRDAPLIDDATGKTKSKSNARRLLANNDNKGDDGKTTHLPYDQLDLHLNKWYIGGPLEGVDDTRRGFVGKLDSFRLLTTLKSTFVPDGDCEKEKAHPAVKIDCDDDAVYKTDNAKDICKKLEADKEATKCNGGCGFVQEGWQIGKDAGEIGCK